MSSFSLTPIFNDKQVSKDMKIGKYGELACEYCNMSFHQTGDGILRLTLHILVAHGHQINPPDTKGKYVIYKHDWEKPSGSDYYEPKF